MHEPRKMKALLIRALGQAAQDGRDSISPDDLPDAPKPRPFGFLSGLTKPDDETGGGEQQAA